MFPGFVPAFLARGHRWLVRRDGCLEQGLRRKQRTIMLLEQDWQPVRPPVFAHPRVGIPAHLSGLLSTGKNAHLSGLLSTGKNAHPTDDSAPC